MNKTNAGGTDLSGQHYDATTIWLHWATVVLVIFLWGIGQTADLLPKGPLRSGAWSIHVLLGFATTLVLIARIVWRAEYGATLPPADKGALQVLAKATHYALYALLVAVVVAGILNASYRGTQVFGVWSVPKFGAGVAATRRSINDWHELAANTLVALAALHAAAALVHQFVWRDRLIARMRP
ncbi:MAG TPA: cytochrome b/b6 domain-containing protein [Usitatibacter sp.]|jgi:cytochrome b561